MVVHAWCCGDIFRSIIVGFILRLGKYTLNDNPLGHVREEPWWSDGHAWPEAVRAVFARQGISYDFDEEKLNWFASRCSEDQHLVFSMASREHAKLAVIWSKFALGSVPGRFVLISCDEETSQLLAALKVPYIEASLHPVVLEETNYSNSGGFDAKGAAIILARMGIIRHLVGRSQNVIQCDLDALPLADPTQFLSSHKDMSFQRVKYHPDHLAEIWGFTCCGGFAAFNGNRRVADFLELVIEFQKSVSSDQISLNMAMYEIGVHWDIKFPGVGRPGEHRKWFCDFASTTINGSVEKLKIESLKANQFWRHKFVRPSVKDLALVHPNSPKDQDGKLIVLDSVFELVGGAHRNSFRDAVGAFTEYFEELN